MKPKNNALRWLIIFAWLAALLVWLGTQQLTLAETIYSTIIAATMCLTCLMLVAWSEGRI